MKTFPIYCKSIGLATLLALTSVNANSHSVNHKATEPQTKHDTRTESKDIDRLIRQYSLSGDDHLIEEGWTLWRASPAKTPEALLQGAWLAQAEHQFDEARALIAQALALSPNNPQAWLLEASIALIQGDRQAARQACRQVAHNVSPIVSITCNARLANNAKDIQKSYNTLTQLSSLSMGEDIKPWVYSTTADLAKSLGNLKEAEHWYFRAIQLFPSVQNRAAYLDILLDKKKYQKVITLVSMTEPTPALSLRRLMAKKALGHDIEQNIHEIDHVFKHWIDEKDFKHAREMALFYLDIVNDVKLAHSLARENFAIQKETEDRNLLERSTQQLKSNRL